VAVCIHVSKILNSVSTLIPYLWSLLAFLGGGKFDEAVDKSTTKVKPMKHDLNNALQHRRRRSVRVVSTNWKASMMGSSIGPGWKSQTKIIHSIEVRLR
jgi:hypothetical protein